MNRLLIALALFTAAAILQAGDPKPPVPKEQRLLQQLAGEWEYDSEAIYEPGKPPVKSKGAESVRALGETWVIAEHKGTALDAPFTGILTLGYNAEKKKITGTWICSLNSAMIHYEGMWDEAGATLTLLTETPNPAEPGKTIKLKDVIAIKTKDHKVLTSSAQAEDGKWTSFMTATYRRKPQP